jgi:formylmethanofuran dehydrogenase subunit A
VKKTPEKIQKFGLAMELFSSGEGYEVGSLVEGYDWAKLGEGTIVDVSTSVIFPQHQFKLSHERELTIAGWGSKWICKFRHI